MTMLFTIGVFFYVILCFIAALFWLFLLFIEAYTLFMLWNKDIRQEKLIAAGYVGTFIVCIILWWLTLVGMQHLGSLLFAQ